MSMIAVMTREAADEMFAGRDVIMDGVLTTSLAHHGTPPGVSLIPKKTYRKANRTGQGLLQIIPYLVHMTVQKDGKMLVLVYDNHCPAPNALFKTFPWHPVYGDLQASTPEIELVSPVVADELYPSSKPPVKHMTQLFAIAPAKTQLVKEQHIAYVSLSLYTGAVPPVVMARDPAIPVYWQDVDTLDLERMMPFTANLLAALRDIHTPKKEATASWEASMATVREDHTHGSSTQAADVSDAGAGEPLDD